MLRYVVAGLFVVALVAIAATYGFTVQCVELVVLGLLLARASFSDLETRVIPNSCVVAMAVVRLVYLVASVMLGEARLGELGYYLASALVIWVLLAGISLAFERFAGKPGIGGGDLKLYAIAAFYVGLERGMAVVIVSCIVGAVAGLVSARKPSEVYVGERTRQSVLNTAFAFGPVISLCLLAALIVP